MAYLTVLSVREFFLMRSGHDDDCSLGTFKLHPRCMAVGTRARPYTPCNADSSDYDASCEPLDPAFVPNGFDAAKAKGQSYEYLVQKPLASGELLVATRGKQMAIAIGHVGLGPFFLFFDC
jgi:hypothetical protein